MKQWTKLLVVIFVITGIGYASVFFSLQPIKSWYWKYTRNKQRTEKFMNKISPDIETTTIDGKLWRLSDHKGKLVLLDFWASWCPPCVASIPKMKEIYQTYSNRDDFIMVGIPLDEDKTSLNKFCEQEDIRWLQLYEDGIGRRNSVARKLDILSIPSIWIINREGNIVAMDLEGKEIIEKLHELFKN